MLTFRRAPNATPSGEVVLQVLADLVPVGQNLDAKTGEERRRPDSGAHQQLRRVDRTCCENHLAPRTNLPIASPDPVRNAGRSSGFDDDAPDTGAGSDHEVSPRSCRSEVGVRCAHATAVSLIDRGERYPCLDAGLRVGQRAYPTFTRCCEPSPSQLARISLRRNRHRAADPVDFVGRSEGGGVLETDEVGEQRVVAPLGTGFHSPRVEVAGGTTDPHHRVHR